MILRRWRGAVATDKVDRYLEHQADTGVRDYRDTEGNLGVVVLRRDQGALTEVVTLSLWTSMDAVRRFAGDYPGTARFYPGDDDYLIEKDLHADHHEVVGSELDAVLLHFTAAAPGPG